MTWFRMPLFLWALYATAFIQVLATPVLGITLLMMIVERAFGIGIFDPALGGDPVLFQHFFWFYSHPAVYIMIVPGFGVVSEIIPVFSRKRIFGYKFIAISSLAIALLGFLVWGHHMFTSGQSVLAGHDLQRHHLPDRDPDRDQGLQLDRHHVQGRDPPRDADALRAGVPLGVHHRRLTGLFLAVMSVDVHLHDTYFVVAHFHYVMMGGAITALHGRDPLLVAEGVRQDVRREAGQDRRRCSCSSASTSRSSRSSCSAPAACRAATTTTCRSSRACTSCRRSAPTSLGLGFLLTAVYLIASLGRRSTTPDEPLGRRDARVADRLAAALLQLPHAPRVHQGPYDGYDDTGLRREDQRLRRQDPSGLRFRHGGTDSRHALRSGQGRGAARRARARGHARRTITATRQYPHLAHHFDSPQQQFDAGKLGIWLFLLTEVLFFSGLFCAYTIYRAMRPEVFVYAHYFLDTQARRAEHLRAAVAAASRPPGRCATLSWPRPRSWC